MSINCRIQDNKVFAPNGNESILYRALENKFGEERAMEYYVLTETEQYKDSLFNTDSNGEMVLSDFLNFALEKPSAKDFTQESLDLQIRVGKDGIRTLKKSLIKEGIVSIDEQSLNNTEIFTRDEVEYILNTPEALTNLKEFVKNAEPLEVEEIIDPYLVYENNYNSIGLKTFKNPSEVKRETLSALSQANTIEEVYYLINTIEYPQIIKGFKDNVVYRDIIIEDALKSKEVERQYDNNYIKNTVLNTLDVNRLDEIEIIANDILTYENRDFINEEFLSLIDSLRNSGLNVDMDTYEVSNLEESTIKDIAQNLSNLAINPSQENIESLAESLTPIFKLQKSEIINKDLISEKVNKIVYQETDKNELEIFEEKGFIRHGENVYQKIDDKYNLNQLYDILYNKVVNGSISIPVHSVENIEQLQEPLNKSVVVKDIQDYIKSETKNLPFGNTETQQKIAIYKTYYNAPKKQNKRQDFAPFVENEEYLKNEFISDFSKFINYNKDRATSLYNNFLKFFKVDANGIQLTDNSDFTMAHIKNNINNLEPRIKKDLENYSILSKKLDLQLPSQRDNISYTDIDFQRMEITENPFSVPELSKRYAELNESDIVVEKNNDQFIRVKNQAYEKTQEYENVSVYSKLPTPNSLYKNTNITRPDPQLDYEDFKGYTKPENKGEINMLVGSIQLEEINENHFNCE